MRDFIREHGGGVRQTNVRTKTKELTGTLPYTLSMRPQVISATLDIPDITTTCFIVDAADGRQSTNNIRVRILYLKDDVIAVKHNRRREVSPYWLAVLMA